MKNKDLVVKTFLSFNKYKKDYYITILSNIFNDNIKIIDFHFKLKLQFMIINKYNKYMNKH